MTFLGRLQKNLSDPSCVFIVLDRTLSPLGQYLLKNKRTELTNWPNPAVYSIPELSKKILIHKERQEQRFLYPTKSLSTLQKLALLWNEKDSPWSLFKTLNHMKHLEKIGLSSADWYSVLQQYEKGSSGSELKIWTQRIVKTILLLEKTPPHTDPSDWSSVQRAISLLKQQDAFPWSLLFDRAPEHPPCHVNVALYREPFPLERVFLDSLSKHVKVTFETPNSPDNTEPSWKSIPYEPIQSEKSSAIFWVSHETRPDVVETCSMVPGTVPLFLLPKPDHKHSPQAQAMCLWADYQIQQEPASHPINKGRYFKDILATLGFDYSQTPSQDALLEFFKKQKPELSEDLDTLAPFIKKENLLSWLKVFTEEGFFALPSNTPTPSRIQAQGVPLLTLEDLPLMDYQNIYLWGSAESLDSLTNPLSAVILKQSPFPAKLRECLEAHGVIIPNPALEAQAMKNILMERKSSLRFLDLSEKHTRPVALPIAAKASPWNGQTLSPTGFETFLSCPLKYHFDKNLKLKEEKDMDPLTLPALEKGLWIHNVLEQFIKNPNWKSPQSEIHKLMSASIEGYFSSIGSTGYQQIIKAHIPSLSYKLANHVINFEKPLAELYPAREILPEEVIQNSLAHVAFRGKVDRIDKVSPEHALLWDFKTGSDFNKSLSSLQKEGHVQWLLYKLLIEKQHGLKIVGGGYLNPLTPHKSVIFVFDDCPSLLKNAFNNSSYPVKMVKTEMLEDSANLLIESIHSSAELMKKGEYSALPLKSTCQFCSHTALCGKPDLEISL